ncbi:uncharacterized protein LOC135834171 [Planococcus citri]|uniref:uncharacterized protein LOC135834171 n=1 Tax=Planococcus citri TaxID=170843 RepID=UPI0031F7C654
MPNQESYCGITLQNIGNYYVKNIYEYIGLPICLVGLVFNLLNILVFTRKAMISSSNFIFAHLAFVDFLVLLASVPHFWLTYIQPKSGFSVELSYGWTIYYTHGDNFIITFQFISAFLTVQLAAWRYIAVVYPFKERHWCNRKITRNVVIAGYLTCCGLFTIPKYLSFEIEAVNKNENTVASFKRNIIIFTAGEIINGLVVRLLPSVVLAALTSRIVATLLARKTHQEKSTTAEPPSASNIRTNMKNAKIRQQQTNKSTAILLTVVTLFFTSEFPKGLLVILRLMYEDLPAPCYSSLIAIFVTLSNINISITFMVYYMLGQQFRIAFKSLFNCNVDNTVSHQKQTTLNALSNKHTSKSSVLQRY